MENDSIYRRININKVMKTIQEHNPNMNEADVLSLSYKTIAELNKSLVEIATEFENGEGLFDSCYLSAKDNL